MDEIKRDDARTVHRRTEDESSQRTELRKPSRPVQGSEAKAPTNDGRGRSAEKPSDIPAQGWKDILWRVYEGISDDRILANAAAVTFYALLALFPALAALVSIYGLFADPASVQQYLDSMSSILPGGALDVVRDQLSPLRLSHEALWVSASSLVSSSRYGAPMAASKRCSTLSMWSMKSGSSAALSS